MYNGNTGVIMKESGLRIRVDSELRSDFIENCRKNDQTASQVLRAFMRNYIKNNQAEEQYELFNINENNLGQDK